MMTNEHGSIDNLTPNLIRRKMKLCFSLCSLFPDYSNRKLQTGTKERKESLEKGSALFFISSFWPHPLCIDLVEQCMQNALTRFGFGREKKKTWPKFSAKWWRGFYLWANQLIPLFSVRRSGRQGKSIELKWCQFVPVRNKFAIIIKKSMKMQFQFTMTMKTIGFCEER